MTIDLAVTMPASIFQEKDYLNYRYFYKRAYYLACLAAGIEEDKENSFSLSFAYQDENKLQPVIIVNPGQGADDFSRSKCCIQIILAADEDLFSFVKTLPDKNCVRATLKSSSDASLPTPFYNSTLRSECSSLSYLKYLHSSSVQSAAFTDACVLGSVWLRQRGLGTSSSGGGFGPFEWSCTMAVLLQGGGHKGKPILSKGYSSYQLFKAMLQYLSVKDMVSSPTHVHSDAISGSKSDFPVLFDGERGLNILFKMSPWSYTLLRHEATCTINTFRDTLTNQFDACFITKLNEPVQKYDFVVKLPIKQLRSRLYHSADAIDEDFTFCNSVYQALRTGLDDRVVLVSMIAARMSSWTLEKPNDHGRHSRSIEIGLLLNPEHVNRSVDRGPSADDKEGAAQFRSFWGEKAELRRFKDGSIQESLIWSTSDTQNPILSQIISYIVSRHISEEAANAIGFVGGYFDRLLPIHKSNSFDPLTLYQPAMTAFEVLEQEIRNLEGLPLQIRQISAADPQLRYSSIEVPNLNSSHCKMEPANIFIQFEGSARWPDNLTAVQRTKMAFLLKMGELLEESTEGLSARLGLENTGSSILNAAFLDVVVLSGAFFRLRIHHERELNLLQYTLKDHCHTATIREETATALSTYKRSFLQAPVHTQAIRTLGTRFALLSPTVRLMKKWRDSQLLSHHISDELIELLTIHTFLHPHPWSIPGSLMAGFLRTLTFISKWDWHSTPLIVDSSGKMKPADIEAIHTRFEAWRKIDPAMNRVAIFAASNLDPDGITWTENNPSKVMAARFTSLAKVACTMVKERGLDIQPEVLFTHSLADYDFVIHLKEKYASGKDGQEKRALPNFKNLQLQAPEDKGLVGFNPIRMYVEDLRTIYRSNVVRDLFNLVVHIHIMSGEPIQVMLPIADPLVTSCCLLFKASSLKPCPQTIP